MATQIQLRRGTEADWTSANPILASGEVAISTDLGTLKIGNGTSRWLSLPYISSTPSQVDSAISGAISIHNSDTTSVHGIADTSALATKTYADDAAGAAQTAAEDYADSLATNYDIAGAASTAQSNAQTFATSAINALTTSDIEEGTNKYFTNQRALDATTSAYDHAGSATTAQGNAESYADSLSANYDAVGSASTAQTNAQNYADSAVSTHSSDTTSIHGISNTANLVYTDDSRLSDQRTPSDNSVTSAKIVNGTIVNEDISSSAAIAQSKISGLTTDLSNKQPIDEDLTAIAALSGTEGYLHKTAADTWELDTHTFINTSSTPQTKNGDMTIVGTLTATDVVLTGTGTTIETTNLSVTDSLIYLADQQYDSDSLDIGIYGAYGDLNAGHFHTGLVRDASDSGKWKLVSGAPEPVSNVVDFTGVTYDTLKVGAIEVSSTSVVTNLNADQLDGHHATYFATAADYLTTAAAATTYQPVDGDLTAIAGLSGTSGLLKKTGADTWVLDTTAYSTTTGTVTSVGISVPTGLSVSNTPITSSGTIGITLTSGYSIPTTSSQSNWDIAYTDRNKWDGGSTGLNAATARNSLGLGTMATATASDYATIASPTLTGTPAAPTAAVDTNSTQIATTEYVVGQGYLKSSTASSTYLTQSSASSTYQPLDGDLTAIAANTSNGILKRTGTDTWTTITDNSTNWDTAYTDRNKWDGGSTGLTASTGRTSLGATTVGSNVFTLTNPSAVTFLKINADNTVSTESASTHKTSLGLNNVENTAISTWEGSTNITTLGTIRTGTWQGSSISATYIDSAIARLSSPTLTGTPAAPTATAGTNTTQIATTAFVTAAISSAPAPSPTIHPMFVLGGV